MTRAGFAILFLVAVSLACTIEVPATETTLVPTATRMISATRAPNPTATRRAVVTATRSLNVRAARGLQARVLDNVYHGDTVALTGRCDQGWAEIIWEDGTAWVNADYLSKNKCSEE